MRVAVLLLLIGVSMFNFFLIRSIGFDHLVKEEEKKTIKMDASPQTTAPSWCLRVKRARAESNLPHLQISYPCESLKPAVSAIVCMLTDGTTEQKTTRTVFAARDYINGALALGASLDGKTDKSQTHQLLLLREGFELENDDLTRLESVGWQIGTAPNFPIEKKYEPKFPRYKTTYTKVTVIGLSEYKCALLLDADTLVVGDLRDILKCDTVFHSPLNRVAGVLDFYRLGWKYFNTGSILWKTSTDELERVYKLTKNSSFMKRYPSDQDFLNNVYPERLKNVTLNNEIVALDNIISRESKAQNGGLDPVIPHSGAKEGAVVPLSWDYNAQTHTAEQNKDFWNSHRSTTKILHFTEKKGWQCNERYDPVATSTIRRNCNANKKEKRDKLCFCDDAHLYFSALKKAEQAYAIKLVSAQRFAVA